MGPIRQYAKRQPLAKAKKTKTLLKEMQGQDVTEASNTVGFHQKERSGRFCVDYEKLDDVTKKKSCLLSRISNTLSTLSESKWFSTLDLKVRTVATSFKWKISNQS